MVQLVGLASPAQQRHSSQSIANDPSFNLGLSNPAQRAAAFAPAIERAMNVGKPTLIESRIDPEAISPNTTREAIWAATLRG